MKCQKSHAGPKDVGANGSEVGGTGGRGKQDSRIQVSLRKSCWERSSVQFASSICALKQCYSFYCFMSYNSNLSSRNIVIINNNTSVLKMWRKNISKQTITVHLHQLFHTKSEILYFSF